MASTIRSGAVEPQRRPKAVVGLDFGNRVLKAVEVQRTASGYEILRAGSATVPAALREAAPETVGEWLAGALRRLGIRSSQVVWSVPLHRVFLRWLQLPPGTPEEIAQMVRFQAGKDLPLPIEQTRFNYVVLGEAPAAPDASSPRGVSVLLAAMPADAADRLVAFSDAAGLSLIGATPSSLSMWTYAAQSRPDLFVQPPAGSLPSVEPSREGAGESDRAAAAPESPPAAPDESSSRKTDASAGAPPDPGDEGIAIIDVGWGSTEVLVGSGGRIQFSRSAPVGLSGLAECLGAPVEAPAVEGAKTPLDDGRDDPFIALRNAPRLPPTAAAWAERLIAEIDRSFRAQRSFRDGVGIGRILVAGGGALIPGVLKAIEDGLICPAAALDVSGGTLTTGGGLACGPYEAAAVGAAIGALQEDGPFLNLLGSLAGRRRRLLGRLQQIGIAAGVLVAAALLVGYIALSKEEARLALRTKRLKELKPRVEQVLMTEKKIALASQWGPKRVPLADLLRELTTLFPTEAYVTTMTIDEAGTIRIAGRSKSNQVISKLVNNLNASTSFSNATMGPFTKNNEKGDYLYDYSVTIQIRSMVPEKANGEKPKGKI